MVGVGWVGATGVCAWMILMTSIQDSNEGGLFFLDQIELILDVCVNALVQQIFSSILLA